MLRRPRFKQTMSFKDRLTAFAEAARKRAEHLPPGEDRNDLLAKARQAVVASRLDDLVNSPGERPPK